MAETITNHTIMTPKTPQEVLRTVSADFKIQGLTHAVAAERLGMKSPQTLSNILSSKKYLSRLQADRFHNAFGYNVEYLMSGEGVLSPYYEKREDGAEYYVRNNDTGIIHIIDDTREGDLERVMYWLGEFLSKQENQEGLAFLAVVGRFFQARKIAEQKMRGYKGPASYQEAYDDLLSTLQSNILAKIERMIADTKKGSE